MGLELFVLRHGETIWNAEGRMQGALNAPLTPLGQAQAAAQRRIMETQDLTDATVLCSPQGRAIETAAIALAPLVPRIHTHDALREIEVGAWSGKLRAELYVDPDWEQTPDGTLELYDLAPGGEGIAGLETRCAGFLAGLSGKCVLITHGITSRMIRCLALGLGPGISLPQMAQMPGGQGVVYHVANGAQKRLD